MKLAILGATGKTGRHLVALALAAGHSVRALVRDPAKLELAHEQLEPVQGDATDEAAVRRVVEGCDAVVSALGPTPSRADICGTAARHVVAAGVKRYVAVSGAGIDVPGDQKDLPGKLVSLLVKVVSPAVFADKVTEHRVLAESGVAWTLVRAPRLVDRPPTGTPKTRLDRTPGTWVSRADLAAFALACVGDDATIRKAPFVSS